MTDSLPAEIALAVGGLVIGLMSGALLRRNACLRKLRAHREFQDMVSLLRDLADRVNDLESSLNRLLRGRQ